MVTDKIDDQSVITSGHGPFLKRALAKPEETHGTGIHNSDDDRLVALTKRHERVGLDRSLSRRGW